MNWLIIFTSVATVILIIVFTIRATITIEYKIDGLDDYAIFIFSLFGGIVKYRYRLPRKQEKPNIKEEKKHSEIEGVLDKARNFREIIEYIINIKKYFRKKLLLKQISINIDFGAGDAYYSGILSGVIWAISGIVLSYMANTFKTVNKNINVHTDFSNKKFIAQIHCIFSTRIVYIIIVVSKLLINKYFNKAKAKGGGISV